NNLKNTKIDYMKKEEKKELYLETLYILLNDSIDNKDENRFNIISKEINRIKK
ncbi:MAG: two-component sensor histidine kinase, partial [Clostridium cochlearium]|nr:two-component sensor histidine kinase [Clostridium cochlearium]